MRPTTPIAARLREEREERGWTAAVLARRAKLSGPEVIENIERGFSRPHHSTVIRLARALEIPVEALTSRDLRPESLRATPWREAVLEAIEQDRADLRWRAERVARRAAERERLGAVKAASSERARFPAHFQGSANTGG